MRQVRAAQVSPVIFAGAVDRAVAALGRVWRWLQVGRSLSGVPFAPKEAKGLAGKVARFTWPAEEELASAVTLWSKVALVVPAKAGTLT